MNRKPTKIFFDQSDKTFEFSQMPSGADILLFGKLIEDSLINAVSKFNEHMRKFYEKDLKE